MKARQEADAEQFKLWVETGAGHCPASYRQRGNDLITVRSGQVITSQGAEAPLDHVIKALAFYDSPRGRNYHTNGHKIPLGVFTLDSIDEAGNVKAGCHYFTAAEIARFRAQWNL